MIKRRLIGLVPDSRKYIFFSVLFEWLGMLCFILAVTQFATSLSLGMEGIGLSPKIAMYTALLLLGKAICVKAAATSSYYASKSVKRTLRGLVYRKLLALGSTYREETATSEILQLAGEGVEQLETYFGNYLPQFFYSLLAPLTLFVIVSRIHLSVAVVLLLCVPLIPVAIVLVQKIAKRLLHQYWGQYAVLGDNYLENLQGLTTLKVYQADEERHREMRQEAEHFRIITMKVLSMQLNSIIVMDILAYGGAGLGILMAVAAKNAGAINFEGCFTIILLSADFFLPMRKLGSFFHVAMNGMAASDKIFRFLDLPEKPERKEVPEHNGIIIDNLSFSYQEGKEVLSGISLEVEKGSFTALVGESGCGKSTLAALLAGNRKDYSGGILFGGKELSEVAETELKKRITLLSHNSYLFQGTVRGNLLLGKPEATDESLWEALEKVKLAPFLRGEGGLDLRLNEGGSNLSGGQRQRLAMARALLHDSPIYIFDEATSNIDVESENDILSLIETLKGTKTILMISHRLANVVQADRIYVLEKGKVVEEGSHGALLEKKGSYRRFWDNQQRLEGLTGEAE